MNKNFKSIIYIWMIISLLTFANQLSIINYTLEKLDLQNSHLNFSGAIFLIIFINILMVAMMCLSLIIVSLIMHFIGVITNNDIGKLNYLYIISFTFMINMLISIPLFFLNIFQDEGIITTSQNLYFMLLNPFVILAIITFYKLLRKYEVNLYLTITYMLLYYIFQIVSQLFSQGNIV